MAPEMLAKYLFFKIDQVTPILSIIIAWVLYFISLWRETLLSTQEMLKKYTMPFKTRKLNFQLTLTFLLRSKCFYKDC